MDKSLRNTLRNVVTQCRHLLEDTVSETLEGQFGIFKDGKVEDDARMGHLSAQDHDYRVQLIAHFEHIKASGAKPADAIAQLKREAAFTHLNRLCAYKMMEARGLIRESVSRGMKSPGFMFYMADHPDAEQLWKSGGQETAYQMFLEGLASDLSKDIGVLFSAYDPANRLFPTHRTLSAVLELINSEELAGIWTEDETIGWVYQYFTPKELRDQARKESQAPRNSYELSFRNQFYTPRYVVEFLTDNTLGRTWYEMRHGETALAERCKYLVRRPDEVFLDPDALKGNSTDTLFLAGKADDFPPFHLPVETLNDSEPVPGEENTFTMPYYSSDEAGHRLIAFAYKVRPFDWVNDPRRETIWKQLLESTATGANNDPVDGKTQDLWDLLLAIARANRFSEGTIAEHVQSLTRIANEIRRRLLITKNPDATAEEQQRAPVLIPYRAKKDPREIRIIDPACGSGHFLLYCFDLLTVIYEEAYNDTKLGGSLRETYPTFDQFRRATPGLILAHNLHGIDIDPRATQIAALALWLRAQRSYAAQKIRPADRPPIRRTNIVCAEPMPGEAELLAEFVSGLQPPALGGLVTQVFAKMKLAGEAGSLLKIEAEIASAVQDARREFHRTGGQRQKMMPGFDTPEPERMALDFSGTDAEFWERAEPLVVDALRAYSEQISDVGGYQRRLFAEDAAHGFAFVDVCQKSFDVALMNPPFGAASSPSKSYIERAYPRTKNDVFAAFVERWLGKLNPGGLLGAITSRTGFFLSSFQKWREEVLLKEARPVVFADLGNGVLDAAMVETAAYCLERVG